MKKVDTGIFTDTWVPMEYAEFSWVYLTHHQRPIEKQLSEYKALALQLLKNHSHCYLEFVEGEDALNTALLKVEPGTPAIVYDAEAMLNAIEEFTSLMRFRPAQVEAAPAKVYHTFDEIASRAIHIGQLFERLKARLREEDARRGQKVKAGGGKGRTSNVEERLPFWTECRAEFERVKKANPHLSDSRAASHAAANLTARFRTAGSMNEQEGVTAKTVSRAVRRLTRNIPTKK